MKKPFHFGRVFLFAVMVCRFKEAAKTITAIVFQQYTASSLFTAAFILAYWLKQIMNVIIIIAAALLCFLLFYKCIDWFEKI